MSLAALRPAAARGCLGAAVAGRETVDCTRGSLCGFAAVGLAGAAGSPCSGAGRTLLGFADAALAESFSEVPAEDERVTGASGSTTQAGMEQRSFGRQGAGTGRRQQAVHRTRRCKDASALHSN